MGGCASTGTASAAAHGIKARQGSGRHMLRDESGRVVMSLRFGCNILSSSKDQDRFVCVPELTPGVFLGAVFDGHGGLCVCCCDREALGAASLRVLLRSRGALCGSSRRRARRPTLRTHKTGGR